MQKSIDCFNGFLVFLMFISILYQIIARLVLKVSSAWTVEIGIVLYVFIVFLGIASLTRNDNHLRVDVIYQLMGTKSKRIIDFVINTLILLFLILLSIGTYRAAINNINVRTPTIEWFKWGYLYLYIFFTTLLHCLFIIMKIFALITIKR